MALLEVRDLSKAFAGVQAVDGVSFDLADGERLAMIGPNGAGKSTCFNLLNGQLRPDRGTILLGGVAITGLAPHQIWRHGVGRTFQITATFGSMCVAENVQMALLSWHHQSRSLWRPARRMFREQAHHLLEQVGLLDQAGRRAGVLAYGDLKRLELAVSLANHPRLLLMDEPTAGMPGAEREALMRLVEGIVSSEGISVLFTEHDMDTVFNHASRILVLHKGAVLCSGSAATVRSDPRVQEIYLGADPPGAGAGGHA